jgi:hypothetical protein
MVTATKEKQASLRVEKSIEIAAPIQVAFDASLEQLGPSSTMHEQSPMPMKLEPWPGGRWFRDLGNNAGHLWGHVQVIKPPTLLEITGPLFMSYPALSHIQYRLIEEGTTTTLKLLHRAIGELEPEHCEGVHEGWQYILQAVQQRAETTS